MRNTLSWISALVCSGAACGALAAPKGAESLPPPGHYELVSLRSTKTVNLGPMRSIQLTETDGRTGDTVVTTRRVPDDMPPTVQRYKGEGPQHKCVRYAAPPPGWEASSCTRKDAAPGFNLACKGLDAYLGWRRLSDSEWLEIVKSRASTMPSTMSMPDLSRMPGLPPGTGARATEEGSKLMAAAKEQQALIKEELRRASRGSTEDAAGARAALAEIERQERGDLSNTPLEEAELRWRWVGATCPAGRDGKPTPGR